MSTNSECMVGAREWEEGEEKVRLCREPFSMEKPFSAMWEVKLVVFSTMVRGQLLLMPSIYERGQLKPTIQHLQK